MNKRGKIGEYIKNNLKYSSSVKFYLYPSDKIIRKIKKYYDRTLDVDGVVAFIDETVFGGGKNGMVFTTTGVYCRNMMEKPFYFNYQDITKITNNLMDGDICGINIMFSNGERLFITNTYYDAENLTGVLLHIKDKILADKNSSLYSRSVGTVGNKKINLSDGQKRECNTIIHAASVAAGAAGAGMAQLFVADAAVITPIQIAMVTKLGDVFGFTVGEGLAKGIIQGAMAAAVGRGAVQLLVGWVPGIGNAINTATAAGLTEAIGWMAVRDFYNKQVEWISKDTFEAKFRKQAEEFLNREKDFEKQKEEYDQLLNKCKAKIRELEAELEQKSGQVKELEMELASYRNYYDKLINLKVG